MMSSKVHSQRNIPFSWENEPGVSKAAPPPQEHHHLPPSKLPPPPCPPENTRPVDLQIPLPPCAFQPPKRSCSKKGGLKKIEDDPFLIAYKEVTKSVKKGKSNSSDNKKVDQGSRVVKKNMSIFSCKQSFSCSVVEDSIRLGQLPISKLRKD